MYVYNLRPKRFHTHTHAIFQMYNHFGNCPTHCYGHMTSFYPHKIFALLSSVFQALTQSHIPRPVTLTLSPRSFSPHFPNQYHGYKKTLSNWTLFRWKTDVLSVVWTTKEWRKKPRVKWTFSFVRMVLGEQKRKKWIEIEMNVDDYDDGKEFIEAFRFGVNTRSSEWNLMWSVCCAEREGESEKRRESTWNCMRSTQIGHKYSFYQMCWQCNQNHKMLFYIRLICKYSRHSLRSLSRPPLHSFSFCSFHAPTIVYGWINFHNILWKFSIELFLVGSWIRTRSVNNESGKKVS